MSEQTSEEHLVKIDKEQLFNYNIDLTIKLPITNGEFKPNSFLSMLGGIDFISKFQVENMVVDKNKLCLMMNIKTISGINKYAISHNQSDTYKLEFFKDDILINTMNDVEFWNLEETFNNYINNLDNDN